jgi:type I restriction enzyme S subunit
MDLVRSREDALALVREFRQRLEAVYGDRLKRVYLYGSYARDEATEDSDVDVAVVLAGPVHRWTERHRVIDVISDLSLREGCLLMPVFLSEEEARRAPYEIHRSIAREGIAV